MYLNHLPQHLKRKPLSHAVFGGLFALGAFFTAPVIASGLCGANPCAARKTSTFLLAAATNPCAAKNPCNPCAARNPCGAGNPCNPCGGAKVAASQFKRPAGVKLSTKVDPTLLAEGKRLWNDKSLSTNGLSCASCHKGNSLLNATFAQDFPHKIAMPSQMAGTSEIYADEMVQFCLLVPMQSKALPWNSRELAALTSYTLSLQRGFNPCAAKKAPAGACNPCNPCAAKRACNPCNPCAAKKKPCNPCNPCAARKKKTSG